MTARSDLVRDFTWTGRTDSAGDTHKRWHTTITLADAVELTPRFDVDNCTARTAARLLYRIGTTAASRLA